MAPAFGFGKSVGVFSAEPVTFKQIKRSGVDTIGQLTYSRKGENDAYILCNPGGEETWDRHYNNLSGGNGNTPLIVLNNAYSTTYDLGNKRGFEEGTNGGERRFDGKPFFLNDRSRCVSSYCSCCIARIFEHLCAFMSLFFLTFSNNVSFISLLLEAH